MNTHQILAALQNENLIVQITDCHIGSQYELLEGYENTIVNLKKHPRLVFTGDNVDLRCCNKKDIIRLRLIEENIKKEHFSSNINENTYLVGNHEALPEENNFCVIQMTNGKRVLCAHYDLQSNYDKWSQYRKKSHGAGWFKINVIMKFIDKIDELIDRKIKPELISNIVKLAKENNCDVAIGGHFHPNKIIREFHDGVEIIVSPQGANVIELY